MLALVPLVLIARANEQCNQHETPPCEQAEAVDPVALSLSPRRGPTHGGQLLKVEGLRLRTVTAVFIRIGGAKHKCTPLKHIADNLVQCTTAAAAEGEGQVLLMHTCASAPEQQVCRASRLRYSHEEVRFDAVSPAGGPPAGGTRLELRGRAFDLNQVTLAVQVGGLPCAPVKVMSAEVLSCASPPLRGVDAARAGVPQPVRLLLSTNEQASELIGGSGRGGPKFTYHSPPIISSISPAAGPVDGGTSLTLFGSFFADPIAVHIKGASCAYVKYEAVATVADAVHVVSAARATDAVGEAEVAETPPAEMLRCTTTRASAGSGEIVVSTRRGGKSSRDAQPAHFVYTHMPELTALHPAVGPVDGGTVLRLEGRRLGARPGDLLGITVGGVPCRTVTHDSSGLVGCTTPPLYAAEVRLSVLHETQQPPTPAAADPMKPGVDPMKPGCNPMYSKAATLRVQAGNRASSHGSLAVVATIAAPHPADPNLRTLAETPLRLLSSELRLSLTPQPRISAVSPLSGPRAGGTRLTISGGHLGTHAADVLNVTLGDAACGEARLRLTSPHIHLHCAHPVLRVCTACTLRVACACALRIHCTYPGALGLTAYAAVLGAARHRGRRSSCRRRHRLRRPLRCPRQTGRRRHVASGPPRRGRGGRGAALYLSLRPR